ncbi:gamma-glutamylcyclotransferase family protein [Rubripirellula tenax]|nr:gamma-glutamylcyclotransferase family protein [Rubripirellula tenax]
MIQHVFVYGTLKTGQCRATMWPAKPISIEPAWVRGQLFGRSDYPAMMPGEDRVLGEIWHFAGLDMPRVTEVLDQIEGTGQVGFPDLYVRVVVDVFGMDGHLIAAASAYHYAKSPEIDGFRRIDATDFAQWPSTS